MARSIARKMMVSFLAVALLAAFVPALLSLGAFRAGLFDMLDAAADYDRNFLARRLETQYAVSGGWAFLGEGEPVGPLLESLPPDNPGGDKFMLKRLIRPEATDLSGPWWTALMPSIAVLDKDRAFLAGNAGLPESAVTVPLYEPGSPTPVGYLLHSPSYRLETDRDAWRAVLVFFSTLMSLVTLLTALAVWLLARHFRKPINAMNNASRNLAAGRLDTRLTTCGAEGKRDELQEMAWHFNNMAESLEAGEKARRQWVADTSHELRTPLTVALGTAAAMRDGLMPMNAASLERLEAAMKDMDRLVEELHFLAKSDAGKLECSPAPLSLASVFQDIQRFYPARAAQAGHRLLVRTEEAENVWLLADGLRLRQVMHNVLQNAVQYTASPGSVEVGVQVLADNVVIICDDSQPCPDSAQREKLFQRFFRGDASRSGPGSGLGLAISRDILQAMRGEINAQPSPLGGLRLLVSLPRIAPPVEDKP